MFEGIYDAIHHEMDVLEDKYSGGAQISTQDLENMDKMAHTLKCLATYEAMTKAERRPAERYSRYDRRY